MDEHRVRVRRIGRRQCNVPGLSAECFDHEHALREALRCVHDLIDRPQRLVHRRIEPQAVTCPVDVVIYSTWYADDARALFGDPGSSLQRPASSEDYQSIDAARLEEGLVPTLLQGLFSVAVARGPEETAAAPGKPAHLACDRQVVALQQAHEAAKDAANAYVPRIGALRNRSYAGVHAGRITPAGKDTNGLHTCLPGVDTVRLAGRGCCTSRGTAECRTKKVPPRGGPLCRAGSPVQRV